MRDDLPNTSELVAPSVDVTLKPGWTFDATRRVFVSEAGERVSPQGDLPRGSRIVPMVASLAAKPVATLSAPERFLARSMQVVLPKGKNATEARKAISRWACVETAALPPAISLPK